MWDMGKKVDESRIEWSSGMDDGGALSTKFDQNLLRAKNEMKGQMKKNLMNKINSKKQKNGDGSAKGAHEDGRENQDSAIAQVVEDLWEEYGGHVNGYLNMNETRSFIQNNMGQVGGKDFDEEAF